MNACTFLRSISYCYATDTEDLHGMCETLGKKILPVLDFIKYSKLAVGILFLFMFFFLSKTGSGRERPWRFVQ